MQPRSLYADADNVQWRGVIYFRLRSHTTYTPLLRHTGLLNKHSALPSQADPQSDSGLQRHTFSALLLLNKGSQFKWNYHLIKFPNSPCKMWPEFNQAEGRLVKLDARILLMTCSAEGSSVSTQQNFRDFIIWSKICHFRLLTTWPNPQPLICSCQPIVALDFQEVITLTMSVLFSSFLAINRKREKYKTLFSLMRHTLACSQAESRFSFGLAQNKVY